MNSFRGISGSADFPSIFTSTTNATIPITKPAIIIGFPHPIDEPKFKARRIPASATTSAMIPGTSIATFPSLLTFGIFIPISTTPRISGTAGIRIATFKSPISVRIPAIILPPNPPTAIAVASIPIAFGTSFLSLIRPAMMYGAAVNAPCANPIKRRRIISGTKERTNANAIPHTAQMIPGITTIFLRPIKSPSFPPIGVIIDTPIPAKIENRDTYPIALTLSRIGDVSVANTSPYIATESIIQIHPI